VSRTHEVIICGAGINGISAAYFLAKAGIKDILILDERPPLSLTSDRSTECYRNWWPDPEILKLMNHSIDLMEQLADENCNIFRMNRRGYLYVTANEDKIQMLKDRSYQTSRLGGGSMRIHTSLDAAYQPAAPAGFHNQPDGADLLLGNELIRKYFPFLTEKAVAALHIRRAGWLSAQQLGMVLLESAHHLGVKFESAHLKEIDVTNYRVNGIKLSTGERLDCSVFINAAGPYLKEVGKMLGIDIPVQSELHLKIAFRDHLGVVRRDAPLLIWDDAQFLPWDPDERAFLNDDPGMTWLTKSFPAGAHTRPEGTGENQTILMVWEYKTHVMEPVFPLPLDELFPEIVLRGLSTMLPRLKEYFSRTPRPQMDGGYYIKTRENRLLAGPLPIQGAYIIGAASGYGIMAACAAGELLAAHIAGLDLPSYAPEFSLERYDNGNYQKLLENWGEMGQL
jgi:glycine/D-amino acid oxidase-like deaminating enzyme